MRISNALTQPMERVSEQIRYSFFFHSSSSSPPPFHSLGFRLFIVSPVFSSHFHRLSPLCLVLCLTLCTYAVTLQGFEKLGQFIGTRPALTIFISLLIAIAGGSGFMEFEKESRGDRLWVPQDRYVYTLLLSDIVPLLCLSFLFFFSFLFLFASSFDLSSPPPISSPFHYTPPLPTF